MEHIARAYRNFQSYSYRKYITLPHRVFICRKHLVRSNESESGDMWKRAKGTKFSLFPRGQHIKRCNSVALLDEGSVITGRPGLEVLRCPATVRPDLWGGPSNFPVDGGKVVGQVAYYHFSIRRASGTVRACLRAMCVNGVAHARAPPCHRVHSLLVPLALDKGIGDVRGCSL